MLREREKGVARQAELCENRLRVSQSDSFIINIKRADYWIFSDYFFVDAFLVGFLAGQAWPTSSREP